MPRHRARVVAFCLEFPEKASSLQVPLALASGGATTSSPKNLNPKNALRVRYSGDQENSHGPNSVSGHVKDVPSHNAPTCRLDTGG